MRRPLLALLAAVAALPAPAHAACAIADPTGDTTLADDVVLGGAHDVAVPSPSLDLVSARVTATAKASEVTVAVADLTAAAAESPTGVAWSWEIATGSRTVFVDAWSGPTGSGVDVYAGRSLTSATFVGRYAAPRVDTAKDTVTFAVPGAVLAANGVRPGTPVTSTVRSWRVASVTTDSKSVAQSLPADSASIGVRPWGRC